MRDVAYVVVRRQVGASSFLEVARTSAVTYTDAPGSGTFDYAVRTAVSTFTSTDSPLARAAIAP